MLETQVIPIDYGFGLDTKTDPKRVQAGKLLRLENGVFTDPRRVAKRNGYQSLGTFTDPKMVKSYKDELLVADSGNLYSRSPSNSNWFSKGPYVSTEIKKLTIDQSTTTTGAVDCAILGNYALYVWETANSGTAMAPDPPSKVYASVVDIQTNTVLEGPTLIATSSDLTYLKPRAVCLGGTQLAVVFIKGDNTDIFSALVTVGSGTVTFGANTSLTTNFNGYSFDVVQTAAGGALAYRATTGMKVALLNTSGAATSTVNLNDIGVISVPVCLSRNTYNNSLWIYWLSLAVGDDRIKYAVLDSALGDILNPPQTAVAFGASITIPVTNMIATSQSATGQTLYYGTSTQIASTSYIGVVKQVSVTSAGAAGSVTTFVRGVIPFSKPFTVGSDTYTVMLYLGLTKTTPANIPPSQATFFVIRLTNVPSSGIPLVVARFGSGSSFGQIFDWTATGIIYSPSVSTISTNKMLFACGQETQEFNSDYWETLSVSAPFGLCGTFGFTIDFAAQESYHSVTCGDLALLNGGVVQQYDGKSVSEFGFHLFPEIVKLTESAATGGLVVDKTYSYIAIFQWVDGQGNLHQSAPSLPVSIKITGANNTVTAAITAYYLTQKTKVAVMLYRTEGDGTVYYLVNDPVFLTYSSPTTTESVAIVDGLSDANILGNPQPYTYPDSAVLENSTPPPSMLMTAHNNRLWFVNSENENEIWYTKSFFKSIGLSPSAFLTELIDDKFGNIAALSEMDEKLVILKKNGIFLQSGDGPTDTGSGSTLSFPQYVPSDVGCSHAKSVVLMPDGVIFKSANGLYLLARSTVVTYIGMEVEDYNQYNITAAHLVPGKSQIRFLSSDGTTLVYDYIFKQWSTFTSHTGYSADNWNGGYIYLSTAKKVMQEVAGLYTDAGTAFNLLAQTAWITVSQVQGFQRIRRIVMLGDFTNGASTSHNIRISAAYDFGTTFSTPVSYQLGAAAASGYFQYRERLPIQKCNAISLLIEEVSTGDSSEYIDFSNLAAEIGVKRGINKLSARKSVG